MKRIKSVNGYTIYEATTRDEARYNVEAGYFYLYFSSDIRDYGLSCCDPDMEAGSLAEAEAFATGTNYAAAREYVEASSTAATYEEIAEIEKQLDAGLTVDDIAAAEEEAEEASEIAATIAAAREYVTARRDFTGDLWAVKNDAANIYSSSYEEYLLIWDAIKNF